MIKDIVVNLGLGEHDPAGNFAISVANTFGAHLLGVAFVYDPVIPGSVMGGIPPEFIESQRRESEKNANDAIDRFEQVAKRAGISYEARSLNASVSGAADRLGRLLVGRRQERRRCLAEPLPARQHRGAEPVQVERRGPLRPAPGPAHAGVLSRHAAAGLPAARTRAGDLRPHARPQ